MTDSKYEIRDDEGRTITTAKAHHIISNDNGQTTGHNSNGNIIFVVPKNKICIRVGDTE